MDVDYSKIDLKQSPKATEAAEARAMWYIKEAVDIDFKIFKEKNDIYFGDLIVCIDNKYRSLTNELVEAKMLAKNEILFWQSIIFLDCS